MSAKIGDLRVWHITNPPNDPTWIPVRDPATGWRLIEHRAKMDLDNPSVWGNAFGLCAWDGEEWSEWSSDSGYDLDAWAEEQGLAG